MYIFSAKKKKLTFILDRRRAEHLPCPRRDIHS
jgi:hypothetical protein